MENKIFRKTISVDHVKLGFDPKMVLHFYFHYKPFPGQTRKERDREREKRELPIHPIAPQHQRCQHLNTGITIYLAPPPRSHHHWRPIHPDRSHPNRSTEDRITPDRSTQNQSHWRCCYPWPILSPSRHYPSPRPISPFPSIFDHSLFLPLSVWPNGGV